MSETLLEERPHHRRALWRSVLLYVPSGAMATVAFAMALYNLVTGSVGAIVAVVLVGLIAFALDYAAIAALRDLRSRPLITEGEVQRTWSKGRIAFFGRVHYLLMEGRVFEVLPTTALDVGDGERLRVEHWPHTNTVISVRRAPRTSAHTDAPLPPRA